MEREPVTSSNIVSIGYDTATETLEVEFATTGTYQYYNVPESIHQQLMEANSKGTFFNTHIRNAYSYSRA